MHRKMTQDGSSSPHMMRLSNNHAVFRLYVHVATCSGTGDSAQTTVSPKRRFFVATSPQLKIVRKQGIHRFYRFQTALRKRIGKTSSGSPAVKNEISPKNGGISPKRRIFVAATRMVIRLPNFAYIDFFFLPSMPAKENRKSGLWVTRSENRNSRPKGLIFGQNGEILWRRAYRSKSAETLHNLIFGQAKRAREEIAPEALLGGAHQKTIRKSGNPDLGPTANFQISAMSGRISPEDGSLEPQREEKIMCGIRIRRARGVQELQISTDLPDPNRLNRGALCAARRRDQGSKKKKKNRSPSGARRVEHPRTPRLAGPRGNPPKV